MKQENQKQSSLPFYSAEFKQSAVEFVLTEGLSRAEVCRRLGIPSKAVGRWITSYQANAERAFPGRDNRQ